MSFPWRGQLPAIRTTVRLRKHPGKSFERTAEVPEKAVPGMRGPDAERRRDGARSSLVWDVLQGVIAARAASLGRDAGGAGAQLDIVDVGGGTGGFAVPFAALGLGSTTVTRCPSPDALAA